MNQNQILKTIAIAAFALTNFLLPGSAAEAKPLSKSQAAQLLVSMGYEDAEVGAIVQGFAPMTGSQNVATVLGIGRSKGQIKKLEVQFFYDADVGWFGYEYDGNEISGKPVTKLRMWTPSGYSEVRPKFSLTDSSATEKFIGAWQHDSGMVISYTKDGGWQQTFQKSVLSGTWKIERGVIISTVLASAPEPVPSDAVSRWQILSLDDSTLVIKGSQELILRRKAE